MRCSNIAEKVFYKKHCKWWCKPKYYRDGGVLILCCRWDYCMSFCKRDSRCGLSPWLPCDLVIVFGVIVCCLIINVTNDFILTKHSGNVWFLLTNQKSYQLFLRTLQCNKKLMFTLDVCPSCSFVCLFGRRQKGIILWHLLVAICQQSQQTRDGITECCFKLGMLCWFRHLYPPPTTTPLCFNILSSLHIYQQCSRIFLLFMKTISSCTRCCRDLSLSPHPTSFLLKRC